MFRKLTKHHPKTIQECLVSVEKTLRRGGCSEEKIQNELRDIESNYLAVVEAYRTTGIATYEAVLRALEECAPLLSIEISQNKLIWTLCFGFFSPVNSVVGISCTLFLAIVFIIHEYKFGPDALGQNYPHLSATNTLFWVSLALLASLIKSLRLVSKVSRARQMLPHISVNWSEVSVFDANSTTMQVVTAVLLRLVLGVSVFSIIVICLTSSHQLLLALNISPIPLYILAFCLGYVYPGFIAYTLDYTFAKPLSSFLVSVFGVSGLDCVIRTAIRTGSDDLDSDPL